MCSDSFRFSGWRRCSSGFSSEGMSGEKSLGNGGRPWVEYARLSTVTGLGLMREMLDKAVERVHNLAMPNVALKVMDATSMDFGDNEFDKAVATYTISAVPDPVAVLREMRRVVKPDGIIVILNHFRSE